MTLTNNADYLEIAKKSKAWPFDEARKLIRQIEKQKKQPENIVFETGYGPSGLPHIGTFGEVARTTMVRHAFEVLTEGKLATRLICFSDDMDGFRKVPTNVPHQDELARHLNKPLTQVPDPFGTHDSFGAHNNARLRSFLDKFGFEYEFFSATECYKSGLFDQTLLKMLATYDEVMDTILPTLGEERQRTYSPFLPICQRTGLVLQVPMVGRNVSGGTITYIDPESGERTVTPVTGGRVKCQWKADWALRWVALGVNYEMAGKDLIDSVRLSGKICRILGGIPPEGFSYELFLDEAGEKISKSKGNGLTIDEWLKYAAPESLSYYMYQKPKSAKKLYFDVIPKTVDEYLAGLSKYGEQELDQKLANPVWHVHSGDPPEAELPISFNLLLNLVSASNASEKEVLWGFIRRYAPDAGPDTHPVIDHLAGYAITYFHDFVKPTKVYRVPDDHEREALQVLADRLSGQDPGSSSEEIQKIVYEVGKQYNFENLRDWFKALYEILLGQSQGPRFGSFVELYGLSETVDLINRALDGENMSN